MSKTIIVTGGSRGIGKAIIEYFASNNFNIGFCSLHQENIELLISSIRNTYPEIKIYGQQVNMRQKNEVMAFGHILQKEFSSIDVLVNNAGTFRPGLVYQEEDGLLEELIETNLYSAYHMSRSLIPKMLQQGSGHIMNISSIAGLKAYHNGGSYSISKFAMQGLSKALREELMDKKIRVTTIFPGAVFTDSWKGSGIPDERFIDVHDIAKTIFDIYALSDRTVVEEIVIRPQLGDI